MTLVIAKKEHFEELWPTFQVCLKTIGVTMTKERSYVEFSAVIDHGFFAFMKEGHMIVGFIMGQIFLHFLNEQKAAHDCYWWVHENHRKKGVGKLLLIAFESWAKVHRCNFMNITSSIYGSHFTNTPEISKAILEHEGYTFFGYQMRKKL